MQGCGQITLPTKTWDTYTIGMSVSGILLGLIPHFEPAFKQVHWSATWITRAVAIAVIAEGIRPDSWCRANPDLPPPNHGLVQPQWDPPTVDPSAASTIFVTCLREMPDGDLKTWADGQPATANLAWLRSYVVWEEQALNREQPYDISRGGPDRRFREHALRLRVAHACGIHPALFTDFVRHYNLNHDLLMAYACVCELESEEEEGEQETGLQPIIERLRLDAHTFQQHFGVHRCRQSLPARHQALLPALDRIAAEENPARLDFAWGPITAERYLTLGIWLGLSDQLDTDIDTLQQKWRFGKRLTPMAAMHTLLESGQQDYITTLAALGNLLVALTPPDHLDPSITQKLTDCYDHNDIVSLSAAGAALSQETINIPQLRQALGMTDDGDNPSSSGRQTARPDS